MRASFWKRCCNITIQLLKTILAWEVVRVWLIVALSLGQEVNIFLVGLERPAPTAQSNTSTASAGVARHANEKGDETSATAVLVDTRQCSSPENKVTWPYGGCDRPTGRSRTSPRTCGFCAENAANDTAGSYLAALTTYLRHLKEASCRELIVYSVAFGRPYHGMLQSQQMIKRDVVKTMLDTHGPCFVTFMIRRSESQPKNNSSLFDHSTSRDGLDTLVWLDPRRLPYRSGRRNGKIFKMNPHLLFPWAHYAIYQDSKFRNMFQYFDRPVDYHRHVKRTLQATRTCASFATLPYHTCTMDHLNDPTKKAVAFGCLKSAEARAVTPAEQLRQPSACQRDVSLAGQCEKIIQSIRKRPGVTDSGKTVDYQCTHYLNQYSSRANNQTTMDDASSLASSCPSDDKRPFRKGPNGEQQRHPVYEFFPDPAPALDDKLIDGALLTWDLQAPGCREWIADFLCTWLDEVHCFADRDQISFPYTVQQMPGLYRLYGNHTQATHRVWADPVRPRILFVKGHCSWYHHKFYKLDNHPWHACQLEFPANLLDGVPLPPS